MAERDAVRQSQARSAHERTNPKQSPHVRVLAAGREHVRQSPANKTPKSH